MTFEVKDGYGRIVYKGEKWPMARAALEYLLMYEPGCPQLKTYPTKKE